MASVDGVMPLSHVDQQQQQEFIAQNIKTQFSSIIPAFLQQVQTQMQVTYPTALVDGAMPLSDANQQQQQEFITQSIKTQLSSIIPTFLHRFQTQMHEQMLVQVQAALETLNHNNDAAFQQIQENLSQLQHKVLSVPIPEGGASELTGRIELLEQSLQHANIRTDDQTEALKMNTAITQQMENEVKAKVRDLEQRVTKAEKTAERAEEQCVNQNATCTSAAASTLARVQQLSIELSQRADRPQGSATAQARETVIQEDTEETSIFIKGVQKIKTHLHNLDVNYGWLEADPADAVSAIFRKIGAQSAIQRMIIADIKSAGSRQEADSVIIKMTSIYQKKSAMFRIRNYIYHTDLSTLMMADCYPQEQMTRARALVRYCGYLKRQAMISGYSVTNWQGKPDAQTYSDKGGWQRLEVDEGTLQPFYATRNKRDDEQPPLNQQAAQGANNMEVGTSTVLTRAGAAAAARAAQDMERQRGRDLGAVGRGRGGGREEAPGVSQTGARSQRGHRGNWLARGRPNAPYRGRFSPVNRVTSPNNVVISSSSSREETAAISQARKERLLYEGRRTEIVEARKRLTDLQSALGPPPPNHSNPNYRNALLEDGEDL